MFDDEGADGWAPFALTRPCGELRFGRWTLRERLERVAAARVTGHLTRPWLRRYVEAGAPASLDPGRLPVAATYWNARAVPALDAVWSRTPANLWVAGRLAGIRLASGARPPRPGWFAAARPEPDLPDQTVPGDWLHEPWDLVSAGPARLAADLAVTAGDDEREPPSDCWRVGGDPIRVAADARVEPGVLFDVREGPIELGAGTEVRSGTRLAGPLYAGPNSRLLGGAISRFASGPHAVVRGEIDSVTVLGHANKAHEGYLGHAYVGRWVNLGAMTTNSDLKHTYGPIRVGPPGARADTGLAKFGCLVGDHAKTGIGTRLDAGTVVGAGASLFGAGPLPKWVEPFSWGAGGGPERCRREAFLRTAGRVVARRGVEPDKPFRDWLGDVWDEACGG